MVLRVCEHHPRFSRFADDAQLLEVCEKLHEHNTGALNAEFWRSAHVGLLWNLSSIGPHDVISHESAAILLGMPIMQSHLPKVELCNPLVSRSGAAYRRHKRLIDTRLGWGTMKMTVALRTALDLAADRSVEAGVLALDWLLSSAEDCNASKQQLAEAVEHDARLAASVRVGRSLAWANGMAESPAESLARVRFAELDMLDDLQQQVAIMDATGGFVARVDFLLRGKVVIEVDGATKYAAQDAGGHRKPGEDPLVAEKRREYQLQALGYRVVRLMWVDIVNPRRFAVRLREAGILT